MAAAAAAPPARYDHALNSPNSAFSHMAARDSESPSQTTHRLSHTALPFTPRCKRSSSSSPIPMEWEPLAVGPRHAAGRKTPSWQQRNPSPADSATRWRRSDGAAASPPPVPSPNGTAILTRPPRPSSANYEKRMSASLAMQAMRSGSRRNSSVEEMGRNIDPVQREAVEAELAQQWAYTLGAELAHHVVGVFADPRSSSYNKRWNSEMATRVFGANPWGYLTNHKFFVPPFVCPEVVKSMPGRMKDIHSAVSVVSGIVSTRNELQHVPFPEDLYLRIKKFKKDKLMRHLLAHDKDLHDFLSCEKLLADWFIGTPRIYRLVGQLLFNFRGYLNIEEDVEWATLVNETHAHVSHFLKELLYVINKCNNKEWYKHEWPCTILDLAEAMDRMERIDESFGPKLEKEWRKLEKISTSYKKCVESGLLTPAVRKFCSLPCAFLDNVETLGLREIC